MAVMTRTKELLLGLFRNYLPLSGGTMTGEIEFSPNQKLPSGLVIGQIVESVLPLTDAGLHLLDGAKLPATGMYAAFYAHCQSIQASHPSLFVSESDWQSTFNTYGSCGKFVIDSDGVRLPSISNIIQGTSDASQLGALVEAGLPNVTGMFTAAGSSATLAFQSEGYVTSKTAKADWGERTWHNVSLDASRSSSIYGNSETVQPQTIKVLLYICVAQSVKLPILADVDQIATDLNAKLDRDLSNVIGSHVERVNSSGSGYVRFESGVQICWGRTSGGDQYGDTTVTFPAAFKDTSFGFSATAIDANGDRVATTARIMTNGYASTSIKVKLVWVSSNACEYFTGWFSWIAIGRWK